MSNSKKLICITGATGSIGFRLARRLSDSGQALRAIVRSPARAAALHNLANIELVTADLQQPASLRDCLQGCSLVYHCAAKLSGSNRAAFRAINVTGTQALLEEAVRSGIERFVHLSTISVYGLAEAQDINEDFPFPTCRLPYNQTKQAAVGAVWAAAGQVPVTAARLGDVVGPGQHTWTINFIEKINQGIMRPPSDTASGTMNPLYIDNLIDALILLGTHPLAAGQAFNVVDGTPILFSEYIRRLAKMANKPVPALPVFLLKAAVALLMGIDILRGREASATPGVVDYLLRKATFSGSKIRSILGWAPAVSQAEAFQRTEAWLRSEGYLSQA